MSHARAKSQVWLHFTDMNQEKKVQCLYCPQILSVTNKSTYSLIRHLTKKHPYIQLTRPSNAEDTNNQGTSLTSCKHDDMELEPLTPDSDDTILGYEIEELISSEDDDDKDRKAVVPRVRRLQTIFLKKPEKQVLASIGEAKKHLNDALVSMKSLSIKRQLELDEYDHFAHMIAVKLRKIQDIDERETVMNSIHNVVYQALRKNI